MADKDHEDQQLSTVNGVDDADILNPKAVQPSELTT